MTILAFFFRMTEAEWSRMCAAANAEVCDIVASLPAPLRAPAAALPVTLERTPSTAQIEDGIEPDTLGLFIGPEYADQEITPFPVPPQIILFVENLWDLAENDEEWFRKEIRTTFLHELGHYLGLDEDDLYDRGLE
jgi:predicted Zn-dependent protease with MMP-like domain